MLVYPGDIGSITPKAGVGGSNPLWGTIILSRVIVDTISRVMVTIWLSIPGMTNDRWKFEFLTVHLPRNLSLRGGRSSQASINNKRQLLRSQIRSPDIYPTI